MAAAAVPTSQQTLSSAASPAPGASPAGEEAQWKFAQCFGDKGDSEGISDGMAEGHVRRNCQQRMSFPPYPLTTPVTSWPPAIMVVGWCFLSAMQPYAVNQKLSD